MSKVTIILPIHEFGNEIKNLVDSAIQSVLLQVGSTPNLLIVYTHIAEEGGLLTYLEEKQLGDRVKTIKNIEKTDFCGQINYGVENIDTPYFSILEFDDEYSRVYFRKIDKHLEVYNDISMYLPITIDVDIKTGKALQLVNQNIWSKGYVGENGVLGYLNVRSLNEFSFYTIGGAVINKEEFLNVGGLKSNILLAFTYEFILRFLNNGNKIYTVPVYGYQHNINRDGSLFMGYGATFTEEDRRFWFETAKKESYFINDRVIDTAKKILIEETVQK